jgi:hypothetical protein
MATKKKAARKTVSPRPARKRFVERRQPVMDAPLPAHHRAPKEAPKRNGYILVGMVAVLIAAVVLRNCREEAQIAPPPAPAPAAVPTGVPTAAPEGRHVAPAPAPAKAEPKPAAGAHRATAGETGEPSLEFDRSKKDALVVRAWRPEGGKAQLDVFGPRNQRVRTLSSESGAAGWQSLPWDGKDANGKSVPAGLYYLRPSGNGLQQVRDVWVKG